MAKYEGSSAAAVYFATGAVLIVIVILCMKCYGADISTAEHFNGAPSTMRPAEMQYRMGPYDGLRSVDNPPAAFHDTSADATIVGYDVPLLQQPTESAYSQSYPPIDGDRKSPKHLHMLARNPSHPECCPSTYSTSTGCVCMTPAQKKWLANRGANA